MSRFSKKTPPRGNVPTPYALRPTPFLWVISSGFSLVRTVTTRMRAFYERRYKKQDKKPLSRFIFITDVILILIVMLLVVWIAFVSLRSLTPSFTIKFQAPEFFVATPTPIAVSISAVEKSGVHRNVRAFWKLPSGVEIIEANPKIESDGSVYIGSLSKEQEVRLHLIVRAYRPLNDKTTIGLQIQEGSFFDVRSTYASVTKVMQGGGLFAEIPSEIQSANRVVAHGAVIPIRVVNQTDEMIPLVEIRSTDASTVLFSRQALGDLAPHEEKFVFIPLGNLEKAPVLGWSLVASSFEVSSGTWRADIVEWPNEPEFNSASVLKQNATTTVDVSDGIGSNLIAMSSVISPTVQIFPILKNEDRFALKINRSEIPQRIAISPFRVLENGSAILGSAEMSLVVGKLPLITSIRYISASGDQIGAGSHPPKLNEETRYWIFFRVEQSQTSLKDIHVRAVLPKGVEFTGSVAVPDGGTWTNSRQALDWKLSQPISSKASSVIGAEISITPTVESSSPRQLISSVTAEAVDIDSGVSIEVEQGSMTTEEVDKN